MRTLESMFVGVSCPPIELLESVMMMMMVVVVMVVVMMMVVMMVVEVVVTMTKTYQDQLKRHHHWILRWESTFWKMLEESKCSEPRSGSESSPSDWPNWGTPLAFR